MIGPLREATGVIAENWSNRNQRWLSQRFQIWAERLSAADADGAVRATVPPLEDESAFQPAAVRLQALFGLSVFETELIVLVSGIELDATLRRAVANAQRLSPHDGVRVSFALALALLPSPHWDAISPLGPLRHWSLLDFDHSAGIGQSTLRIDERVLHFITGVSAFDESLIGMAELDEPSASEADSIAARIADELSAANNPLLLLTNATADAARRRSGRLVAAAAFTQVGLRTLRMHAAALGGDHRDLMMSARRIDREAALTQAGIAITLPTDAAQAASAMRFVSALRAPVAILGSPAPQDLAEVSGRTLLRFSLPTAEASAPARAPIAIRDAAARALQQFRVDPSVLEQALAAVARLDHEGDIDTHMWNALREAARGGLDALAQRIDSRAEFDDLVVPAPVAAQLREIASQLRHRQRVYDEWGFGRRDGRGLGIAALFAGESGTGKTLAAEAIANEARLDLYRIDLASVVSKYIGETEKNLSRVFDAAEQSGAVLLFDEADALFGKRSEVKDSHDRYANIEVAYLLQRVESYRGLAILTTNMRSALDRAFLRRIRFVVQFPFPDEDAREEIWRRQFPASAPLDDIDFSALSRLQLSGGNIRSVAVNAAFHAAGRHESIGHAALIAAARSEFAKLERTFTSSLGASS